MNIYFGQYIFIVADVLDFMSKNNKLNQITI